jgi:hypothetical protein
MLHDPAVMDTDFPITTDIRDGVEVLIFAEDFTWPSGDVSHKGEVLCGLSDSDDGDALLEAAWLRQSRPLAALSDEVRARAAKLDRDVWRDPVAMESSRLRERELDALVRIGKPLAKARGKQADANQTTFKRRAAEFRARALELLKVGHWTDSAGRICRITANTVGMSLGWPKSTTHDLWSNLEFRAQVGSDVTEQLSAR